MSLRILSILYSGLLFLASSCTSQKIETGATLDQSTVDLIKSLRLIGDDEAILKYYSNFEKDRAGNFFTNKRIAHYWLDKADHSKSEISYAFYADIVSLDTVLLVPDEFAPFISVTKKDSSTFKVYVDGTKDEIRLFCSEMIATWKQNRH